MIEFISQPWPWYIAGPLIGLLMLILLIFGKAFEISGNLRTICSMCQGGKFTEFFRFDWKKQKWNLVLIIGAVLGGYLTSVFFMNNEPIDISINTITHLNELGFKYNSAEYVPSEIFGLNAISSLKGLLYLITAGLLIGFGTRYAGGCTSGHAISGLSNLQLPSLIAVIGFFIGGLIATFFIIPFIF